MAHSPGHPEGSELFPRKSFLKFVCGSVMEGLTISENGYWIAHKDGMVGCFSSHNMGDASHHVFDVPGVVLITVDAVRLVAALRSVLMLCARTDRVEVSAEKGVSCRDKYGNEAVFSLGLPSLPWKFGITGATAELIANALSQSQEKEASFESITPKTGEAAMRMTRGLFEVDFRIVS